MNVSIKEQLKIVDIALRHVTGLKKVEPQLKQLRDSLVDDLAEEANIREKNCGQKTS